MITTLQRRRMRRGLENSKCCSHVFNMLLLLAALAAIGVSVWIFLTVWSHPVREEVLFIIGTSYLVSNAVPAVLGVAAAFVTLIGMCGLCTTHRCTLLWYYILLMLIFVLTIAGSVFNFIFYFELKDGIESSFSRRLNKYGEDHVVTQSIDSVQRDFECCGSVSYTDWRSSGWYSRVRNQHFKDTNAPVLPPSCCVTTGAGNETEPLDRVKCSAHNSTYPNDFMHSQSCSELLYTWLSLFALILAVACAVLFVTELMGVVACVALFRRLGPVYYEEQQIQHRPRADPDWDRRRTHAESRM